MLEEDALQNPTDQSEQTQAMQEPAELIVEPITVAEPLAIEMPTTEEQAPVIELEKEEPTSPAQEVEHTPPPALPEAPLSRGELPGVVPAPLTEDDKARIFRDRLKVLSVKGNAARTSIHQQNLQKIIAYLKRHGFITNDQVEELCSAGNTDAWKLLKELQKSDTVVQIGQHGPRVRYRLREGSG